MTKTEQKRVEISIRKLNKCGGNCIKCNHVQIKTASEGRNIYYCFYCDIDKNIQPYSNTLKNLHAETLEALQFEIS